MGNKISGDIITSTLGGVYGMDQVATAVNKLSENPNVENSIHLVAAMCIVGWAYYTNKHARVSEVEPVVTVPPAVKVEVKE